MSQERPNEESVKQAISAHVDEWVDRIGIVRNDYVICPYARKAWRENQVRIEIADHDRARIYEIVEGWDDSVEVIIIALTTAMAVEEAQNVERHINKKYRTVICILDHPEYRGYIDDIYTGNGKYVFFLIQNREKLHKAHVHLLTTDYYDKWSKDYYDEVVKGRYD